MTFGDTRGKLHGNHTNVFFQDVPKQLLSFQQSRYERGFLSVDYCYGNHLLVDTGPL